MENFTPVAGLIGGALIGLGSVLLMGLNGRVAGISGVLGGILSAPNPDHPWRLAFVAGLILAPLAFGSLGGQLPAIAIPSSAPTLVIAGLLVGYGTRLGSGCTSGHGICGLSSLSPRSLVATLTFMGFGMATVAITRHVIGG